MLNDFQISRFKKPDLSMKLILIKKVKENKDNVSYIKICFSVYKVKTLIIFKLYETLKLCFLLEQMDIDFSMLPCVVYCKRIWILTYAIFDAALA